MEGRTKRGEETVTKGGRAHSSLRQAEEANKFKAKIRSRSRYGRGYRAGGDMEGEGEAKGGADVEFSKVESKVWKEERGNEESTKKKEATKNLERGKRQQGVSKEVTSKKH